MNRQSFQIGQQAIFGMSFLVASFAVFLVVDHWSSSRHLQRLSGLNMAAYWVANFIWSMSLFTLACVLVVAVLAVSNVTGFTDVTEQGDSLPSQSVGKFEIR